MDTLTTPTLHVGDGASSFLAKCSINCCATLFDIVVKIMRKCKQFIVTNPQVLAPPKLLRVAVNGLICWLLGGQWV